MSVAARPAETERPVVSVVIPTYDRPEMVKDAVASVLAQGVDVEAIVVDDHSPRPYVADAADAHRIQVLRQPQCLGVAAARNRGMAAARGRFVAFLDDDDRFMPGKLARQLETMAAEGRRWCYTGSHVVDESLQPMFAFEPGRTETAPIEVANRISTPSSVIVERDLLWQSGGFSATLSVLADWDLWIRLWRVEAPAHVDEPLVQYVKHDGAMHRTNIARSLADRRLLAWRHGRGRHLGGFGFWMWTIRSLRRAGRPWSALGLLVYTAVRFPRAMAQELLGGRRSLAGTLRRVARRGLPRGGRR